MRVFRISPRNLTRALILTAFSLAVTAPSVGFAALPARSSAQIHARWLALQPTYTGTPNAVTPRWSDPYVAGSLDPRFLQDGLNSLNYARFLAGLPDDLELDGDLTQKAQYGAVLLAAGQFAHSPPKPADMPQDFYEIAHSATRASSIGWGYSSLVRFNFGCMHDSDAGNIDRVGHRRWILNPPLKRVGMGHANNRSSTYVFDRSRVETVDYDSIKWPAAGVFPVEMFKPSTAWSVTLNPKTYSISADAASHSVVMRRRSDGRMWTFTSADTNKSGEYYSYNTSAIGVANCFIFRPDPASVGEYRAGDIFDVTVSGGITRRSDGKPATVSYTTRFASQAVPGDDQTYADGVSPVLLPKAKVGKVSAPDRVTRGRKLTMKGSLKPRHKAGTSPVRIYLWKKTASGKWKSYGSTKAKVSNYKTWSRYQKTLKLPSKGTWRLRAQHPQDSKHAKTWSTGYTYVKVK